MLGDLRELRVQPVSARDHRARHPADPPHEAAATKPGEDLVGRAGQVPERDLLAEHRPEPARMRQRPDQQIRRLLPRRDRQLQPIPVQRTTARGELSGHQWGFLLALDTWGMQVIRTGEKTVIAPRRSSLML